MTNSFFIPSDTKPGKSKISSLLKSLGFIERTSTPLWSYTYTRLRVDQVDFRDDYYDDADWLYDTEFETKWGIRVSLHAQHKPNHKALFQALTVIIAQIYESDELYINANGQDIPGPTLEPNLALEWESVLLAGTIADSEGEERASAELLIPDVPKNNKESDDRIAKENADPVIREEAVEVDDMYEDFPEPTPTLIQVEAQDEDEDDDDDDWGDDDDDDWDDEDEDEEEDVWASDEEDDDTTDDDDGESFNGIVTWD